MYLFLYHQLIIIMKLYLIIFYNININKKHIYIHKSKFSNKINKLFSNKMI